MIPKRYERPQSWFATCPGSKAIDQEIFAAHASQQLQQANDELKSISLAPLAEKAFDQLCSDIAHEADISRDSTLFSIYHYKKPSTIVSDQHQPLPPIQRQLGGQAQRLETPRRYDINFPTRTETRGNPLRRLQQLEVLSDNTLENLRDAIQCIADFSSPKERSVVVNGQPLNQVGGPRRSNSMFVIEGRPYIDRRAEGTAAFVDYSQNCMLLSAEQEAGDMSQTRFSSLQLRLHVPYVFVHQGSCEHLLLFDEIRLLDDDAQTKGVSFPYTIFRLRVRRPQCAMCTSRPISVATHNDLYSGETVCGWCDSCFHKFHYAEADAQQQLYGGFEAIPYLADQS
ncbi:hypothetical protein RI367_004831 [Sorochytrium milnesiophthora]